MRKRRILGIIIGIIIFMLSGIKAYAKEDTATYMLQEINKLRETYKLEKLEIDSELVSYAEIRAMEISYKFSHTRPNGTEGLDIIPLEREWAGENLSYCTINGNENEIMFHALIDSTTHLDNMIATEYKKIGIASYECNGKIYVVYMFSN